MSAPIWRVPLFAPDFGPEEEEAVRRPVREGWLTMGPRVAELEQAWAGWTGARHAVATSNGSTALHLAALGAGVGPGDEVLCPALTFVAAANAIRACGARVVFVESLGPADLNLDPDDCARKITPATRAILLVHYAGFPAPMEALLRLAGERGISVVEDSAHALFSWTRVEGRQRACGTMGLAGTFSLFSNKNITCGEGGMVTTGDDAVARRLRLLRSHGMTSFSLDRHEGRAFSYDVVETGYNHRLGEIGASLALTQLQRLPALLEARRRLFVDYRERLAALPVTLPFADHPGIRETVSLDVPGLGTMKVPAVGIHILPILLPETADRTRVIGHLKERGVQSSVHYPPAHRFQAYRAVGEAHPLPRTEALAARELTLPFFPSMTEGQLDLVLESLGEALSQFS